MNIQESMLRSRIRFAAPRRFRQAGLLALAAGLSSAAVAQTATLYEETFDSNTNANLATAVGWQAYGFYSGGATGADVSSVAAANTLFVGTGVSSPNTGQNGYLAAILGNPDGSNPNRFPAYIALQTGLNLNFADSTISWVMNGNVGATVRVRLIVEIGGELYASAISDTPQKYFSPAAFGTGTDFQNNTEALTKTFDFTTDAAAWEKLTYNVGAGSVSFTGLSDDLSSTTVTGIGFHILGGNTGRIDTLRVTAPIPEPGSVALLAGAGALGIAGLRIRRRR